MAKKSVKRVRSRKSKSSIFQKLFTFPKLVVMGIAVLSALTIYQVTLPTGGVLGVSSEDFDIKVITQAEEKALLSSGTRMWTVHQVGVFIDENKDAKFNIYKEECLNKTVTIYATNGVKTKEINASGCSQPIRLRTKAREITVGLRPVKGYNTAGLTYNDINYPSGRTVLGVSKMKVKGYPTLNQYYTYLWFGVKVK